MATQDKPKEKETPHRACGAMEIYHQQLERFPAFRLVQIDLSHPQRLMALAARAAARTEPYKITVVVHNVYRTAAEKIDLAQIKSQITVLNSDYRAKNKDKSKTPSVWKGLVSDSSVEFQLASVDPDGKPTQGATWTETAMTEFGTDERVKKTARGGLDPWPTDRYLNIWVCNLGGGLLGYAQFPGGDPKTDGVVINYTAFGTQGTAKAPFDRGRTATHEIGHYFNLRHIWGDMAQCAGSDNIEDTPMQEGPNYGKPTFPHVTCNNAPNGDMFVNYMDYVDDDAMVMFTSQQTQAMHATLEGPRKQLVQAWPKSQAKKTAGARKKRG